MDNVDIAVARILPFATGLGVDEIALCLIVFLVWTDSVRRIAEEKTGEIRRRLMKVAGA